MNLNGCSVNLFYKNLEKLPAREYNNEDRCLFSGTSSDPEVRILITKTSTLTVTSLLTTGAKLSEECSYYIR